MTQADRFQGVNPDLLDPLPTRQMPSEFDYSYDHIGNRVTAVLDGGTTNYTINNKLNQYDAVTTNPPASFVYDEDGNLLDDGVYTYEWDGENRLIGRDGKGGITDF